MTSERNARRFIAYLAFVTVITAWFSVYIAGVTSLTIYFIIFSVLLFLLYSAPFAILEGGTVLFSWWIFTKTAPLDHAVWLLPLIIFTVFSAGRATSTRTGEFAAVLVSAAWLVPVVPVVFAQFNPGRAIILGSVILSIAFFTRECLHPGREAIKAVDIILCSYSGNTVEYTNSFIAGLNESGVTTHIHRFHYRKKFTAELRGDALVVAFPVHAWNAPWPLKKYLQHELPEGNGKPAFILYSCAGGPENAHFLPWLYLTRKGYRVAGRLWGSLPMDVTTFRIGPRKLWRLLDQQSESSPDIDAARDAGRSFAKGSPTGMPFFFWPFFLFPIGMLVDNAWVNRFLYRNYVWKKRCTGCGLCVRYCPENRLQIKNGIPHAQGTCALCMGCVNLCPENAMHLAGWTEYGQQYHPLWPQHLVISGDDLSDGTPHPGESV